jgi:hypothetical protein
MSISPAGLRPGGEGTNQPEHDMTELHRRPRHALRSAGAVFAGFLAIVVSTTAIDVVLHATHVFPPWLEPTSDALLLLATAYRVVCSIAGCYLAARLAPDRPMRHALALGAVGVLVSLAGALATWNAGPAFANHWYPLALVAVSMPCAWAGGRLYLRSAGMSSIRP